MFADIYTKGIVATLRTRNPVRQHALLAISFLLTPKTTAVIWATLVLRTYALMTLLGAAHASKPIPIVCFIDDVSLDHEPMDKEVLTSCLSKMDPSNLHLDFECRMQSCSIPLMYVSVVSL